MNENQPAPESASKPAWRRFVPVSILLIGFVLIVYLMRRFGISFDETMWITLAGQYQAIIDRVEANLILAAAGFFVIYALAVAFSVPGALFLTLAGGAIFGWLAGLLVVLAATAGALIVFLAARGAFAETLAKSSSGFIGRLKQGFDRSPFFWLLALRLMPIAPFWVVNIIPALLGMRTIPYTLATLVGIIPGSLVFVYTGIGFAEVLTRGRAPDLAVLSDHRVLGPILALSLLAVIPAIIRSRRNRRDQT